MEEEEVRPVVGGQERADWGYIIAAPVFERVRQEPSGTEEGATGPMSTKGCRCETAVGGSGSKLRGSSSTCILRAIRCVDTANGWRGIVSSTKQPSN
jgi:hypothetical protein